MPVFYVYSPDDFENGLPKERGGTASGKGDITLRLKPDAEPTRVEISDDDNIFHEIDSSQRLTSDIDLDGTEYSAGQGMFASYDLMNSSSGLKVTSVHFGRTGYQQGHVDGLVSSEPLKPGASYTFDRKRTSYRQDNEYDDYVACFAQDTLISTARGPVRIQDLLPGDRVCRHEGGHAVLRLKLHRTIDAQQLSQNEKLRPVRIVAGAMGKGMPCRDLIVSPQHRMLVMSPVCRRMFGQDEVFVSAMKMTALPGVYVDRDATEVTYFHLVFDQHEAIIAEGAPTESFYVGDQAVAGLSDQAREELMTLFPDLMTHKPKQEMARFAPTNKAQKHLVQRHLKNAKALLV